VPEEGGPDNRVQIGMASAPVEEFGCKARVGDERRRITRPPRGSATPDWMPAERLGNRDHFTNRMT
jgi:hypothetical protein